MTIRCTAKLLTLFLLAPVLLQAGGFPAADEVIIDKSDRELHLLHKGEVFRTFKIALGIRPDGDKEKEGYVWPPKNL